MSENAKRMIFLDTQVFERLGHDYQHHKLQTIADLATEGHIAIVLTTITVGEIRSHIDEKVKAACSQLRKCIANHAILRCIKTPLLTDSPERLCEIIRAELHQRFQDFCTAANVVVASTAGVNTENILKCYFEHEQPFGEARNKEGFPDALAAAALEQWANREKQQIEVVTANLKHWQPMCERSKWLRYVGDLDRLLESLQDETMVIRLRKAVEDHLPLFSSQVASVFTDLTFYPEYNTEYLEGDIEDIIVGEVTVLEWRITSVQDNEAMVDLHCSVSFQAEASFEDPDSGIWDSEDHVWLFRHQVKATVNCEETLRCQITITFDRDDPEMIEIDDVSFDPSTVVGVDVSGVEWTMESG